MADLSTLVVKVNLNPIDVAKVSSRSPRGGDALDALPEAEELPGPASIGQITPAA